MADLLPHEPPMILLDRVRGWEEGRLEALVEIRPDSPFCEAGRGVPAHVGIEYMAQACGAYAGVEAKNAGQPVRLGFLLGTRRYFSSESWFRLGETLTVAITEVLREGSMGVFDCRIERGGSGLATARLNVYQPDDAPSAPVSARQDTAP